MKLLILLFILICNTPLWAENTLGQGLLTCTRHSNLDCVESVLAQGADPFTQDRWGNTALHISARGGYLKIVQALLKKNSSLKHILAPGDSRQTPLHFAAERGRVEVLQLLLEKLPAPQDIIIKNKQGETPLLQAVRNRKLETAQLLIQFHPTSQHIMASSEFYISPLHWATQLGDFKMVQLLLNKLPTAEHIMIKTFELNSPLHIAVQFEHTQIIKLLINQLPTTEHIFTENVIHKTPFQSALLSRRHHAAAVIFGNSPLEIKKQLLNSCKEFSLHSPRQVCDTLELSLKGQLSLTQKEVY